MYVYMRIYIYICIIYIYIYIIVCKLSDVELPYDIQDKLGLLFGFDLFDS